MCSAIVASVPIPFLSITAISSSSDSSSGGYFARKRKLAVTGVTSCRTKDCCDANNTNLTPTNNAFISFLATHDNENHGPFTFVVPSIMSRDDGMKTSPWLRHGIVLLFHLHTTGVRIKIRNSDAIRVICCQYISASDRDDF